MHRRPLFSQDVGSHSAPESFVLRAASAVPKKLKTSIGAQPLGSSSRSIMADLVQFYGTGRRKSSIARVFLRPGSGKFTVNKKECDVYFVTAQQRAAAKRSLGISDIGETFDVITTVKGGGVMGQADAVKLGIARALMVFNPELRKALKAEGLVTRDSRGKERKKYGQKGARARFQFSKR
jgi:small subunit ribosomal protein S9